ncbi:hypothetical protein M3212_03825 [Alkalihalobacillus oceani]|uniref:hypothetical protein n=1 Tax=Halalkalibacter oceani TaxID=1653776 RepID=UPI0020416075|nr:hypothetical protein [Halalkalibacter oceani]MCM3759914.1 hypothetical protein [Halalkalibacter oceani]
MLTVSSYQEVHTAKEAIERFRQAKPGLFQKFLNVIHLTRQLQYGYQYMGALIMEENAAEQFQPQAQADYVLAVYKREIEQLKADSKIQELKQFLAANRQVSYAHLSKLALGIEPEGLIGPIWVR